MKQTIIDITHLASKAGFDQKPDGSYVLPNSQETADTLAKLAVDAVKDETERLDIILTGGAPIWAHLKVAHALHGRALRLTYKSPIVEIQIFNHGFIEEA